jgi:plastocyanin
MRLRAWCGGLLAAVLVAGVSGCGFIGAHDASTHGADRTGTARTIADGTQTITVVGNERMTFVPNVIKAHTGRLRIVLKVTGNTPHDLQVSKLHATTGMVEKGKPGSVTVDLRRPGRYDFVCTYHVKEGMTGVIEVS